MVLKVYFMKCMAAKVTTTDTGMETRTMKVDLSSWRNRKRRAPVRMIPVMMLLQESSTEDWMKSPESLNQNISMPEGSSPLLTISLNRLRMLLMTSITLASLRLMMLNEAAGRPLTKLRLRASREMSFALATSRR